MIKYLLFSLFLGGLLISSSKINDIRNLYKNAYKSKETVFNFYDELKDIEETDQTILVAYKAAAIALKAKYAKGVKNKKALFKQGVMLLENKITENPENIELRLIRLSIQENTPKVLKYKGNITEDKSFIKNNFEIIENKNLKNYIKEFILHSKSFSEEEKVLF